MRVPEASQFVPSLNVELLAKGVLVGIRGRNVRAVIDTLKRVQELRISLSAHFDGHAMEIIAKECRRMVKCGHVEEAVEFMEVLARNSFFFWSPIYNLLFLFQP